MYAKHTMQRVHEPRQQLATALQKAKDGRNDSRSGSQVLPPQFAREPFVVRTGKPLVFPRKQHQRL